jgi:Uma2 family endonuclease
MAVAQRRAASTFATVERLTYDDLRDIPQDHPGDRHEIIDGELVVTPSPSWNHQTISANIFRVIDRYVHENSLGEARYAPIDVRLTPDNVLVPDIIFIAKDRLHVAGPQTVDAPPDIVIEILSPGTRRRDLTEKRDLYAQFGVREYWVVDPAHRAVTVFERVGRMYQPVPPAANGAIQSRVLPDLVLTLQAVFEEASSSE